MAADVKVSVWNIANSKKVVAVRYKETVDAVLKEGKTVADLQAAAKAIVVSLPDIAEVKYLATRVCKSGDKYAVIASLRYVG